MFSISKLPIKTITVLVMILGVIFFYFISSSDEQVSTSTSDTTKSQNAPAYLIRLFPETDFSNADPNLINAMSGGPTKDGIPAIDNPKFVSISEVDYPDSVQVMMLKGEKETKVYPYNILTWHEIVNDEIDGTPVAVTFCPLCGSAIVYERTLPDGTESTIGVSGSLLESNMIMYDRATENLWQQSTGENLAGSLFPSKLKLYPMQLLDMSDIRKNFPEALVLSTDTGYSRNYNFSPYAGYEDNDQFAFDPSNINTTLPPKTIMVVFRDANDIPTAIPWFELVNVKEAVEEIEGDTLSFKVGETGELEITDSNGEEYPFYFEMWFSFAVQHQDNLKLIHVD